MEKQEKTDVASWTIERTHSFVQNGDGSEYEIPEGVGQQLLQGSSVVVTETSGDGGRGYWSSSLSDDDSAKSIVTEKCNNNNALVQMACDDLTSKVLRRVSLLTLSGSDEEEHNHQSNHAAPRTAYGTYNDVCDNGDDVDFDGHNNNEAEGAVLVLRTPKPYTYTLTSDHSYNQFDNKQQHQLEEAATLLPQLTPTLSLPSTAPVSRHGPSDHQSEVVAVADDSSSPFSSFDSSHRSCCTTNNSMRHHPFPEVKVKQKRRRNDANQFCVRDPPPTPQHQRVSSLLSPRPASIATAIYPKHKSPFISANSTFASPKSVYDDRLHSRLENMLQISARKKHCKRAKLNVQTDHHVNNSRQVHVTPPPPSLLLLPSMVVDDLDIDKDRANNGIAPSISAFHIGTTDSSSRSSLPHSQRHHTSILPRFLPRPRRGRRHNRFLHDRLSLSSEKSNDYDGAVTKHRQEEDEEEEESPFLAFARSIS
mmetsp:Transcript_19884/g.29552  ORF Transcript_19884/g.29552 Transcript_19884/m.29552 type:complete len:479 (-) Transcript_19884:432-1868(-)